jgi:hypothetical protein
MKSLQVLFGEDLILTRIGIPLHSEQVIMFALCSPAQCILLRWEVAGADEGRAKVCDVEMVCWRVHV